MPTPKLKLMPGCQQQFPVLLNRRANQLLPFRNNYSNSKGQAKTAQMCSLNRVFAVCYSIHHVGKQLGLDQTALLTNATLKIHEIQAMSTTELVYSSIFNFFFQISKMCYCIP